ncbi:helix-turn-helix transcriptional regulator [Paractinoplanes maris]|uniref:helix-turn-helix transcriptional regulator n=1 Tax=Paractinoplanes maris TaxID=1734446 RepID=UPI002021ECA4|nr:LuxR family transcriptional regulator [Actinoplanes maris]
MAASEVIGREGQLAYLTKLIAAASGPGAAVTIAGEPGAGRSALLDVVAERAASAGLRVLRCAGVRSETDQPGAGLHELLHDELGRLDAFPQPQQSAVRALLSAEEGPQPSRLRTGTAVLALLESIARDQPLVVAVDDVQWLDEATIDVLSFVARRLRTAPILLIATIRDSGPAAGRRLPWPATTIELPPLPPAAARQLVAAAAPGLSDIARERVVDGAEGNPLALRECALAMASDSSAAFTGGRLPISRRLQDSQLVEVTGLPPATRRFLILVAAAGRASLVELIPAAHSLGLCPEDLDPAERADVIVVDHDRVRFRRDLLRRAVYAAATSSEHAAAHDALAFATRTFDHASWHRHAPALDHDEVAAAELASAATHAARRGALVEAVRLLRRSARLSPGGEQRGDRLALAAELARQAGHSAEAGELITAALSTGHRPNAQVLGRTILTRSILSLTAGLQHRSAEEAVTSAIALASDHLDQAPASVTELAPLLVGVASVAWTYGISETTWTGLRQILEVTSSPAEAWPSSPVPSEIPAPLLLTMALTWIDPLTGAAAVRDRLAGLTTRLGRLMLSDGDQQRRNTGRLLMATARTAECLHDIEAAAHSWDLVRDALIATGGAVSDEARRLADSAVTRVVSGRVRDAVAETTRAQVLSEELGLSVTYGLAAAGRALAHAWSADLSAVAADVSRARSMEPGPALTRAITGWAAGVAALRAHRHAEAWAELNLVDEHTTTAWNAIADRVEAAVGTGEPACVAVAESRLAEAERAASVLGSAHLCALTLRGRALLRAARHPQDQDEIGALFQEAVDAGRRCGAPLELGRTLLSYGIWLRDHGQVIIARKYFGEAQFVFDSAGAGGWGLVAADQLRAAGVATGRPVREPATADVLTAQERRVAELAASGLTTREVATALHCSERTVTWYLAEVYPKLGVAGRWQLAGVFEGAGESD